MYLNSAFEELSGIRLESSQGQLFSDVARDQSTAALGDDLLNRAVLNPEGISEDYDFSGITHQVWVMALGDGIDVPLAYLLITVLRS